MPERKGPRPDEPPLDPRLEAELRLKLARIQKQTDAGWRESSFWQWLLDRLTLKARRSKQ